ncbi:Hypothetical protein R9X50_00561300 [Acrodontium crateriforme]|uniref:Rhodopsin domain-containing protein n=1 Tax=Acrodontium crateriforme TaxID=150365 RepID=A0AAQ3RBN3_9PEZI|nr:Hypothetical protein R9X50_00561300 [Acrodontium crateriforme]
MPTTLEPAFSPISPDDHRGILWIASILSLIFVLLTLTARIYVRLHMLGPDDYSIIGAVFLGIVQFVLIFVGLPLGLGTSRQAVRNGDRSDAGRTFLASQMLYILAIYTTKVSVLLATERLLAHDMTRMRKVCHAVRVAVAVFALGSLLAVGIECSGGSLILGTSERRCNALVSRWVAISAMDGVSEIIVLVTFCMIVWPLQMKTRMKATLTLLVGLRLMGPIFTALYTASLSAFGGNANPSVAIIAPLVWQQVALGYNLMSALVTALLAFLKNFHTGMGVDLRGMSYRETGGSYPVKGSNGSKPNSYPMKSLTRRSQVGSDSQIRTIDIENNETSPRRGDNAQYSASIYHPTTRRVSSIASNGSERPIIKCDVQFNVTYEGGSSLAGEESHESSVVNDPDTTKDHRQ